MLKTLTTTAIAAALAAPLAFAGTKTIDVRSFDQIETKGAMNVIYTPGPSTSVIIETEGSDFSDADVSVDGDTLVITRASLEKRGLFGNRGNLKVSDGGKTIKVNGKKVPYYTVRVTSPGLAGIRVAQSSTANVSGVDTADFEARTSSAAKLTLSGRATRAEINASSSSEIEAGNFQAGSLDVSASSSGEVSIRSTQPATFTINASSGAEVEAAGACASVDISASSGADVDASKLQCEVATATASSGADVDAFASVSASGNASSGADITFEGRPAEQNAGKSSGGDVTFN